MRRRLWLSIAAMAIGAGLLAAAGFASPAGKSTPTSTSTAAKKGGTLQINISSSDVDYIDPGLSYYVPSWALLYVTCRQLLNYPDKPAPAGTRLYPDGATAFPKISRKGTVLTFTVRSGMRFSDGKAVTAANYAAAIDRDANPALASPAIPFFSDIVGADAVTAGHGKHVSGVVVKGNKLIIKLKAPHADILSRLAMMFFCPVPLNMPVVAAGVNNFAGSGPYYVASRTPGRTIVLKRNKFYKGPRPHNADQIVVTVNTNQDTSLLQVERGSVDYDLGGHPGTADAQLQSKYGLNKKQYFVYPDIETNYFALNTRRGFKNVNYRKAVNFGIDRLSLIKTQGKNFGSPTDKLLPPLMAGYIPTKVYPNHANVKQAKKLLHGASPTVTLYEGGSDIRKARGAVLQNQLKAIGIKVNYQGFGTGVMYKKCGTKGEPFDICDVGWVADYPDPFDFIDVLLNGNNIHGSNNNNYPYFNDKHYNFLMGQAERQVGAKRYKLYGQLDINITKNAAPMANWVNVNNRDFISSGTGCYTFQPIYTTPDFTLLCKK
ncbi:MAG: ABC transporter substrate-binding protein [Gaiellaceae bacterium]